MKKISAIQMVILVLVSRIFTAINISPGMENLTSTTSLVGNLVSIIMQLIIVIPIIIFIKKSNSKDIIGEAQSAFGRWGYIITGLYAVYMLIVTIFSLLDFEYYMINSIFPSASVILVITTMFAICLYASIMGTETLGRISGFVLGLFVLIMVLGLISSSEYMSSVNLIQHESNSMLSIGTTGKSAYNIASENIEIVAILLLLPSVKGNKTRGIISYILIAGLVVEILTFFIILILGEYGKTITFPVFIINSLREMPAINNISAFNIFIWVIISFIRISLYLLLSNKCLSKLLPTKYKRLTPVFSSIIVLVLISPLLINLKLSRYLYNTLVSQLFIIVFATLIPIIVLLKMKTKKGKDKHEKNNAAAHSV